MIIPRYLKNKIIGSLKPGKAIILIGSRRVGKTFLLKEIAGQFSGNVMILNAEDHNNSHLLEEISVANYRWLLKNTDLLIIDEAQTMPFIGKAVKLIVDEIQNVKVILSGSSAVDMLNRTGEPLTGRCITMTMYPVSQKELSTIQSIPESMEKLNERLLYGSYPEVLLLKDEEEKKIYLNNIVQHYLLKDILMVDGIRNSSKMYDLLRLLAFQIGNEVSYNELANKLGINKITVEKYLDLLTKVFVIYKVGAYSKNLRKEVVKNHKWYFYDTGIRNSLLNNFADISARADTGALWENYWIMERIKFHAEENKLYNYFFWRTYDQQEIDFIEEKDGVLNAFEIKWQQGKSKISRIFAETYPDHNYLLINRDNYLQFIQ